MYSALPTPILYAGVVGWLLVSGGYLAAQPDPREPDRRPQPEARDMEHRAAEVRQRGREAELRNLERLHEELGRSGDPDRRATIERRLDDLRRETARHEAEVQGRRPEPGRHAPPGPPDFERRMQHLRQAIEHLHAADLHDFAEELVAQTERLEREHHEQRVHHEREEVVSAHVRELHEVIGQLRREIDELRADVHRMREPDGRGPQPPGDREDEDRRGDR